MVIGFSAPGTLGADGDDAARLAGARRSRSRRSRSRRPAVPAVPAVPPSSSSSPHAEMTAPMNGIDNPMTVPRRMKLRRLILPCAYDSTRSRWTGPTFRRTRRSASSPFGFLPHSARPNPSLSSCEMPDHPAGGRRAALVPRPHCSGHRRRDRRRQGRPDRRTARHCRRVPSSTSSRAESRPSAPWTPPPTPSGRSIARSSWAWAGARRWTRRSSPRALPPRRSASSTTC